MFSPNGTFTLSRPICNEQHLVGLGNLSEPRVQMSAALEVCAIIGNISDRSALDHLSEKIQAIPFPFRHGESFPIRLVTRTIQHRLQELTKQSPMEPNRTHYERDLSLLRMEIDRVDMEIVGSLSREPDQNINWNSQKFIKQEVIGECLEGKLYFTSKTLEFLEYRWKIVHHIGQLKKRHYIEDPIDETRKKKIIKDMTFRVENEQLVRIYTKLFEYIHGISVGIQRGVMKG